MEVFLYACSPSTVFIYVVDLGFGQCSRKRLEGDSTMDTKAADKGQIVQRVERSKADSTNADKWKADRTKTDDSKKVSTYTNEPLIINSFHSRVFALCLGSCKDWSTLQQSSMYPAPLSTPPLSQQAQLLFAPFAFCPLPFGHRSNMASRFATRSRGCWTLSCSSSTRKRCSMTSSRYVATSGPLFPLGLVPAPPQP